MQVGNSSSEDDHAIHQAFTMDRAGILQPDVYARSFYMLITRWESSLDVGRNWIFGTAGMCWSEIISTQLNSEGVTHYADPFITPLSLFEWVWNGMIITGRTNWYNFGNWRVH